MSDSCMKDAFIKDAPCLYTHQVIIEDNDDLCKHIIIHEIYLWK